MSTSVVTRTAALPSVFSSPMKWVMRRGIASSAHGESSARWITGSTPFFGVRALLPVSPGA